MRDVIMKHKNESASLEVLLFSLDEVRCALALDAVEKVVHSAEITPLPGAPEIVPGVVNVSGRIIPVMDTRKRFGLPERGLRLSDRFIIARTSLRPVALIVDSVTGIRMIEADEYAAAGKDLPSVPYIQGAARTDSGIIIIYDLDRFLSIEEEGALGASLTEDAI
jgi:purine-binding chemotaxis protein CheW